MLCLSVKRVMVTFVIIAACFTCVLAQQKRVKQRPSALQNRQLENILSQRSSFTPASKLSLEQLIEVAGHFQIPIGIEWIEDSRVEDVFPPPMPNRTVGELLSAIVRRVPDYKLTIGNGIVHVSPTRFAKSRLNVLNLRIKHFLIRKQNLFDAREELRLAIDRTLHPEAYVGGYVGGWGYDPTHVFAIRSISFSGTNLTVREILDGLIKTYGNTVWLARLKPANLSGESGESLKRIYKDQETLAGAWQFIPFTNVLINDTGPR